jgi:regulator of protease activity HflC (stomatin/prohibitin superfamily)
MKKKKSRRGVFDMDEENYVKTAMKIGFGIFVFIFILIVLFGSFYTVAAGYRGVLLTFGKPDVQPKGEGLHLKVPIMQKVVKIDTRTQKYDASASAASKDLQIVSTTIAVNYHLTPDSVVNLYKEIGIDYSDKVIQPAVQEVVKASTAQFTAEELITKRDMVKEKIDVALKERLVSKGIIMETTSITNFDFSKEFNAAIEQKVTAEQNALTEKNNLAKIEYQAKQKIAEAEGTSQSRILNAQAEAKALELQKAQITPEMLQLRAIEVQGKLADKWDGKLPVYNLGSGAIPLLNMPIQPVAATP